uniref:Uncharacterized protein n=1 Tax=Strombidium inclinatum TaxID=197538 RepID=A0A7S3IL17_9SPIT
MTCPVDHFRRNVLGSADERIRFQDVVLRLVDLGEAEIGEFDVTIEADQDVLGLQVPVENFGLMQVLKSQSYLGGIELGARFVEALLSREMSENLTSLNELHHEVDARGLGENLLQGNDEGVVDLEEDELLDLEALHAIVIDDVVLADALHGVVFLVFDVLNQVDLAEGATPNQRYQPHVLERVLRHVILVAGH